MPQQQHAAASSAAAAAEHHKLAAGRSCARCYRSKTACDGARPCARCVRLGHALTCEDRQPTQQQQHHHHPQQHTQQHTQQHSMQPQQQYAQAHTVLAEMQTPVMDTHDAVQQLQQQQQAAAAAQAASRMRDGSGYSSIPSLPGRNDWSTPVGSYDPSSLLLNSPYIGSTGVPSALPTPTPLPAPLPGLGPSNRRSSLGSVFSNNGVVVGGGGGGGTGNNAGMGPGQGGSAFDPSNNPVAANADSLYYLPSLPDANRDVGVSVPASAASLNWQDAALPPVPPPSMPRPSPQQQGAGYALGSFAPAPATTGMNSAASANPAGSPAPGGLAAGVPASSGARQSPEVITSEQALAPSPSPAAPSLPRHIKSSADLPLLGRVMMRNHALLQSLPQMRRQLERRDVGARRIQFYFAQLSEAVTAEDFAEVLDILPVGIPLSTKAQYTLEEATKARHTVEERKAAKAAAANTASDSSGGRTGSFLGPSSAAIPFSYVHFAYVSSPSRCMSDEQAAGLSGPMAVLRLERLSPFLEEPALFVQRKRGVSVQALKRRREEARRRATVAAASVQALAQAGISIAHTHVPSSASSSKRKRKRSTRRGSAHGHSSTNIHALGGGGGGGGGGGAGGSGGTGNGAGGAGAGGAGGTGEPQSRSSGERRGSKRKRRVRQRKAEQPQQQQPSSGGVNAGGGGGGSADSGFASDSGGSDSGSSASSEYGSSAEESSSSSGDESDTMLHLTSGPLSFPGPAQFHLASCASYELDGDAPAYSHGAVPPSSASSVSTPGGVGSGEPQGANHAGSSNGSGGALVPSCSCPPMQAVSMGVHVNAEFERLFGYTQVDVRRLFVREGTRALHKFRRLDSVAESHMARVASVLEAASDSTYLDVIVNKWGSEVHCLCHVHMAHDDNGAVLETVFSWMPMPDPTPPPMRQLHL